MLKISQNFDKKIKCYHHILFHGMFQVFLKHFGGIMVNFWTFEHLKGLLEGIHENKGSKE